MRASLPMYDLPEVQDATATWWAAIVRHAGLSAVLERPADLPAHWLSRDLLFSQTCGYPMRFVLAGRVRYLATPCYAAEGCVGPTYRSAIVVRDGSPLASFAQAAGARLGINGHDSQSGCNVLRVMAAQASPVRPFFGSVTMTGSHAASLQAIQDNRIDIAAIDCVTLALLRRHRPGALAGLRILAWSPAAPALPYITGRALPDELHAALAHALAAAAADPPLAAVRAALLIADVGFLDPAAYGVIPDMRRRAEEAGLLELSPAEE